jgi:hypothetical protein
MGNSIWKINSTYLQIMEEVGINDGLINEEIESHLLSNENELEETLDQLLLVIRKSESEVNVIDAEISRLKVLKESKERSVSSFKNIIKKTLELRGLSSFDLPTGKVYCRNSESVEISDESIIPKEYLVEKTKEVPSKTLIKEALKSGKEVPGASISKNTSLIVK